MAECKGWAESDLEHAAHGDASRAAGLLKKTKALFYALFERDGTVCFSSEEEGYVSELGEPPIETIYLDADRYHEMGSPQILTVTIKPGDHLNG